MKKREEALKRLLKRAPVISSLILELKNYLQSIGGYISQVNTVISNCFSDIEKTLSKLEEAVNKKRNKDIISDPLYEQILSDYYKLIGVPMDELKRRAEDLKDEIDKAFGKYQSKYNRDIFG